MSDATVRAALVSYLTAAKLPGINNVYQDEPYYAPGTEFGFAVNGGWGAWMFVHLDSAEETRIALPAITGQKQVKHQVSLVTAYKWLIQPGNTDPAAWVGPLDTMLDATKAAIRADPNLGTKDPNGVIPPLIFEAAQDPSDLRQDRGLPVYPQGGIASWNRLEFSLYEVIQG